MSELPKNKRHSVMIDNRAKLVITGVEDVKGFNDTAVSLETTAGGLLIKGDDLHIDSLNLETGEVSVDGTLNAMQYTGSQNGKTKLSKLFR